MFRQVTSTKYIGPAHLSVIQCKNGSFSICKDGQVTKWGTNFKTVKSAEFFVRQHDYINATVDNISMNKSDAEFIRDMYSSLLPKNYSIEVQSSGQSALLIIKACNNVVKRFKDPDSGIDYLEALIDTPSIFANMQFADTKSGNITAGKTKLSSRKASQNLSRVKSSNVWAYGMDVKDSKIGDVYVQFKGENGGPGDVYRYYDVPISLWQKFVGSPSKGHFLWKYLRNNFLYSKLTGDKRGKLANALN